jgi:hypothetical protein
MNRSIDRREFLRSTAAIGAALYVSGDAVGQGTAGKSDDINVALLGVGEQGKTLMDAIMKKGKNSGVRFRAVCDIWPYNRNWVSKRLKAYKQPNNAYEDYREMLDKEKDLDAVLIATPDFRHAEHTIACLEAGLHVYCEKEMSNTLEGARQMVEAAKKSGKLLQIGHQRRSNPRYIYCYEKLIKEAKLLNRITTVNGQWNRAVEPEGARAVAPGAEMDQATLKKYGFKSIRSRLSQAAEPTTTTRRPTNGTTPSWPFTNMKPSREPCAPSIRR